MTDDISYNAFRNAKAGTYEAYLHAQQHSRRVLTPDEYIWDEGRFYRNHMIRAQAAFDMRADTNLPFMINEQHICDYLIRSATAGDSSHQRQAPLPAMSETDQLPKRDSTVRTRLEQSIEQTNSNITRIPPTNRVQTELTDLDREFFKMSLNTASHGQPHRTSQNAPTGKKSTLHTQSAVPSRLSERIRLSQQAMRTHST
jgi:hypothetical protein